MVKTTYSIHFSLRKLCCYSYNEPVRSWSVLLSLSPMGIGIYKMGTLFLVFTTYVYMISFFSSLQNVTFIWWKCTDSSKWKGAKKIKSEIEGHSVNAKDKKNALAGEPTHIMCLKCAWFEKKSPKWLGASKWVNQVLVIKNTSNEKV